jgi:hypothetical protein
MSLPPALPSPSAAVTLLMANVSASAMSPLAVQAALVSALAGAPGCAPDVIFVSGIVGNASVASLGIVLSAESAAAAAALGAALDALIPVTAPSGLAGVLALSSSALAGLTFVDAGGDSTGTQQCACAAGALGIPANVWKSAAGARAARSTARLWRCITACACNWAA